jgi:hypothetical protein
MLLRSRGESWLPAANLSVKSWVRRLLNKVRSTREVRLSIPVEIIIIER